jgi:putative ABC transport system substrate-binding protein
MIGRREFITLLGGAAAWPLAARAQSAVPVIGVLVPYSPETTAPYLASLRQGLGESGLIEGRNVAIEVRYGRNNPERLKELAADLVRRRVAVIATLGGPVTVRAVRAASSSVPIVFEVAADVVRSGLVASLSHPSDNATGVAWQAGETEGKRLELLRMLLPGAKRFAVLSGSENAANIVDLKEGAKTAGVEITLLQAIANQDIDTAFASLSRRPADALLVSSYTLFVERMVQIATLSARHDVPTIHFLREFATVGGLMSYGPNFAGQVRQVGVYVGRILKGEKPEDLPVIQPTEFDFVINLTTARALDINVPPNLLALADEVIE